MQKKLGSYSVIFFLLESNIFISKCFIISHINVSSILETYVRCRNCLTNTLKIWPNFKLYNGASRHKQEQYLKNFSSIFLNYVVYFCACYSPYHTASWILEYILSFPFWISFTSVLKWLRRVLCCWAFHWSSFYLNSLLLLCDNCSVRCPNKIPNIKMIIQIAWYYNPYLSSSALNFFFQTPWV